VSQTVERYHTIKAEIEAAASDAGRRTEDVCLVAVSKTFAAADIEPVILDGHRVFGENRVQESLQKWPDLKKTYPDLVLHLIGPLQSNKVKEALGLFDVIETVDRPSLIEALAREWPRLTRKPTLFVQVNIGEEEQKAGVLAKDLPQLLDLMQKKGLPVEGLMCIPPAGDPPSPYFALLKRLAAQNGLKQLSMGMSADFAEAIQLGATHVRVGSAIFGHR
jgi:pyridoxal phosphate enzyme (YggS family)